MKKVVERMCASCGTKKDKRELIRIVKTADGNIILDTTGKTAGRGAYLCNNIECLEKAIKTKRLEKSLDTKISEEVYESIRGVIIGNSK